MSADQVMSSSESEQQQFCTLFSAGIYCPQRRECPFIHKWAHFHKARKEKSLKKHKNDHRDSGENSSTQRFSNGTAPTQIEKNVKPSKSFAGTSSKTQDAEVAGTIETKRQQPVKDTLPTDTSKSRGKNRGRISDTVNQAKIANVTYNALKGTGEAHCSTSNQPPPNSASRNHADEQRVDGGVLKSCPAGQVISQSISRNMAAFPVSNPRTSSRWTHNGHGKSNCHNNFGRKTKGDIEYQNRYNCQAGPVVGARHTGTNNYIGGRRGATEYEVKCSKPLEDFTIFSELPFEIRLIIWKMIVRRPYNPTVRLYPVYDKKGVIAFREVVCESPTPTVLHINQESRIEALKHYTLTLNGTTYLNLSSGTVFLGGNDQGEVTHFINSIPRRELQAINNFAAMLCQWSWEDGTFNEAIWQFSNIKQLMMMFSETDDDYYLSDATWKLISKELKQPKERRTDWKRPSIGLVASGSIKDFLANQIFP